jgi:hypothetical protein
MGAGIQISADEGASIAENRGVQRRICMVHLGSALVYFSARGCQAFTILLWAAGATTINSGRSWRAR